MDDTDGACLERDATDRAAVIPPREMEEGVKAEEIDDVAHMPTAAATIAEENFIVVDIKFSNKMECAE